MPHKWYWLHLWLWLTIIFINIACVLFVYYCYILRTLCQGGGQRNSLKKGRQVIFYILSADKVHSADNVNLAKDNTNKSILMHDGLFLIYFYTVHCCSLSKHYITQLCQQIYNSIGKQKYISPKMLMCGSYKDEYNTSFQTLLAQKRSPSHMKSLVLHSKVHVCHRGVLIP